MNKAMRKSVLGILAISTVLLLTAGGVAAHGGGSNSGDDDAPENGTAAEWSTWMEQHTTEHMGADAAKQMQDRMGTSYEEMGEHMASRENDPMGGTGCH